MDYHEYIDDLKRKRKTLREFELERELEKIEEKYRLLMAAECEPILKELDEIEASKPPLPSRF